MAEELLEVDLPVYRIKDHIVECTCAFCGKDFDEGDWHHNPKKLEMCHECYFANEPVRIQGCSWHWYFEHPKPANYEQIQLLREQAWQLSAAIKMLENEING